MPVPVSRDLKAASESLAQWLTSKLDGVNQVEIRDLRFAGSGAGFVNETMLFDVSWVESRSEHSASYVIRICPSQFNAVFEAPKFFHSQCKVMEVLSQHTDVPVPTIRWFEENPMWHGAPFLIMDKIDGLTQPDFPPYNQSGWLHDATPNQQAKLWWSTVEMFAKINTVDWRGLGLDFLLDPTRGNPGLEQRLKYYVDYDEWARTRAYNPIVSAAYEWLLANRPPEDEPVALSWGDARLANIIFRDFAPFAIIDWEHTSLGPPLQDLAWWMFLDQAFFGDAHRGDPNDPASLPGFPSREETLARWGQLTGFSTEHFHYYEVFAGYRLAVGLQKLGSLLIDFGVAEGDSQWANNNIATQTLAPLIGIEHPYPEPWPAFFMA